MNDYHLIVEFKPLYPNDSDIVTEVQHFSNEDGILNTFRTLYMHMIKYRYQPEKQTGSWIDTILRSRNDLRAAQRTVKTSIWNKVTLEELLNKYRSAINSAANETRKDLRKLSRDFPDPRWASLNAITDQSSDNFIDEFLIKYAYTDEAKKYLEKGGILK